MKKGKLLACCAFFLAFSLLLGGCHLLEEDVLYITGLENYSEALSSYSHTGQLFMPRDFLSTFTYESGNFFYYDRYGILCENPLERVVLYLNYDEETYLRAKKCALQNIFSKEEVTRQYNGFVFVDNYVDEGNFDEHTSKWLEKSKEGIPYDFTSVGYNDRNCCLIFIGFYCVTSEEMDVVNGLSWGEFLEHYFSEYYDFG